MDKKTMPDAIADNQESLLIPKGIRQIHRNYGLWICKFGRGQSSPPLPPDEQPFRRFEFYDLSHMYAGKGWYCAEDGTLRQVAPGDGILLSPCTVHKYGGDKRDYTEDAISFYGPVADQLLRTGVIRNGVLKIGQARRLLPIIELAQDSSDDSQIQANLALQNLLVDLYFENKKPANASVDNSIDQLIGKIKASPAKWWDINAMSEFCNISPSQFKRLFHVKTGMSPKSYVDNFKMRLSIEMLSDHSKTVSDIAGSLGYLDQFHFSRRFKQLTGHSPSEYKQKFCR